MDGSNLMNKKQLCFEDEKEAFTVECNNQIEAENSSHQALKRAREQLSYRIRYDKSKTIRTEFETEMDKKFSNFSLTE